MLIKPVALALAAALAACLDIPEPAVAERQGDIICGSMCDPEYSELLHDTYGSAFRLFPDAGTLGEGCANLGTGWECVVTLLTPTVGPCGSVDVNCKQQPGAHPPRCSWKPRDPQDGCQP